VNALTTVEIDPKNILTLSQLANLDPSAIKAIMEQRLKDMNWTTYQTAGMPYRMRKRLRRSRR